MAGQFRGMQRATVDEQYSNWILSDVTLGVESFASSIQRIKFLMFSES